MKLAAYNVNGVLVGSLYLPDGNPQPEARECYRRLLAQGWADALRKRYAACSSRNGLRQRASNCASFAFAACNCASLTWP